MSNNATNAKLWKIAILFMFIGSALMLTSIWDCVWARILSAIGTSLFAGGIISALFEHSTIADKLKIMSEAFNNMALGVVIHRNHREIISRDEAVEKHLQKKEVARIMSSNPIYVKKDDILRNTLLKKCELKCEVRILLNIPPPTYKRNGELTDDYCDDIVELCHNIDNYQSFINEGKKYVTIKCLVGITPLSFVAYGNEKIYHGLTMLASRGRRNPCIEIQPSSGSDCIYEAYISEFDKLFNDNSNDNMLLEFEDFKKTVNSWRNKPMNAAKWYLSRLRQRKEYAFIKMFSFKL
jgi:hypothetical protein